MLCVSSQRFTCTSDKAMTDTVQKVFEYGNIKMQQPVTRYGERDIRRFLPGF